MRVLVLLGSLLVLAGCASRAITSESIKSELEGLGYKTFERVDLNKEEGKESWMLAIDAPALDMANTNTAMVARVNSDAERKEWHRDYPWPNCIVVDKGDFVIFIQGPKSKEIAAKLR